MNIFYKNKIFNAISFFVFFLIIEVYSCFAMFSRIMPVYFVLDLCIILVICSFAFIFKSILFDKIYYPIFGAIITMILLININYVQQLNDVFTLQYISLVFVGLGAVTASNIDFVSIGIFICLFIIFNLVINLVPKYIFKDYKEEKKLIKNHKVMFFLLFVALIAWNGVINTSSLTIEKKKGNPNINYITLDKINNFEKLGALSFYTNELNYIIKMNKKLSETDINEIRNFLKNNENTNNVFTGLLNGYNVFTIMIETGVSSMINEILTPTLYSLTQNGLNFTNCYSKNKTNTSEAIGFLGSYSSNSLAFMNENEKYILPFSLPRILNENNYQTMYFHDVGKEKDIYERRKIIPQFDFKNVYLREEIHPDMPSWDWGGDYTLDSETVPIIANKIIESKKEEPFYAFYSSLSMHGPYAYPRNRNLLKSKYYEALKDAEEKGLWSNPIEKDETNNYLCYENYYMACMDFDQALKQIIDKFKEANVYDNTLFVLYGDHDLYYTGNKAVGDMTQISSIIAKTADKTYYPKYSTVLIMSNEKLTNKYKEILKKDNSKIEDFVSPYIMVPTILDLLGVKFNSNYYISYPYFSSQFITNKHIFISYELSGAFNDYYYSTLGGSIEKVYKEGLYSKEEYINYLNKIIEKQIILDKIYKQNVFYKYDYIDFSY